jgi:hypothetical protein
MTASLRIVISTANDVIRVPNQALRFRPNAEIYRALGLEPPAPGSAGRAAGAGNNDENGRNPNTRAGGQGAGAQQGGQTGRTPQGGENRQGARQGGTDRPAPAAAGQSRTPGRGFGQGSDLANMTPEQRQQLMERFARGGGSGRGGRGGGGAGQAGQQGRTGRGSGQGARGTAQRPAAAVPTETPQRDADKIDELWAPVQRTETRSQVYTWNEAAKELKMHQVVLGVTDGSFSELISGDLKVGDQLVTGVVLPLAQRTTQQGNPLFGNQPGMRQPGMGGPGGGGGDRGGGSRPSGGGGGRGGGE